jgi:hypothetical protein
VTRDSFWLDAAKTALPAILARFIDSDAGNIQTTSGPVTWNKYGVQYATDAGDFQPKDTSSAYEAGMAIAATYIYNKTGIQGYLDYAKAVANNFRTYLKDTGDNPGVYWIEFNLAPHTANGFTEPKYSPREQRMEPEDPSDPVNPSNPSGPKKRHPIRGRSAHSLGQTMAMGVLFAELYFIDGDQVWLSEGISVCAAIVNTYRINGRLLNDRDIMTQGYFAPHFVRSALALHEAGADPTGTLRAAISDTGSYIATSGVRETNYYSGGRRQLQADDDNVQLCSHGSGRIPYRSCHRSPPSRGLWSPHRTE